MLIQRPGGHIHLIDAWLLAESALLVFQARPRPLVEFGFLRRDVRQVVEGLPIGHPRH